MLIPGAGNLAEGKQKVEGRTEGVKWIHKLRLPEGVSGSTVHLVMAFVAVGVNGLKTPW